MRTQQIKNKFLLVNGNYLLLKVATCSISKGSNCIARLTLEFHLIQEKCFLALPLEVGGSEVGVSGSWIPGESLRCLELRHLPLGQHKRALAVLVGRILESIHSFIHIFYMQEQQSAPQKRGGKVTGTRT